MVFSCHGKVQLDTVTHTNRRLTHIGVGLCCSWCGIITSKVEGFCGSWSATTALWQCSQFCSNSSWFVTVILLWQATHHVKWGVRQSKGGADLGGQQRCNSKYELLYHTVSCFLRSIDKSLSLIEPILISLSGAFTWGYFYTRAGGPMTIEI